MANPYRLDPDLLAAADNALSALRGNIDDVMADHYEARSEKWQDSERGQSVLAWIETVQDYIEEAQGAVQNLDDAKEWEE